MDETAPDPVTSFNDENKHPSPPDTSDPYRGSFTPGFHCRELKPAPAV